MNSKTSLWVFLFLLFSINVALPQSDTCRKLIWQHDPDNNFFNPDSVLYDSYFYQACCI